MGTWRKTYPSESHKIKQIPQIMQDNFDAIEDTWALEHSATMTEALSGMHSVATSSYTPCQLPGIMHEGPFTSVPAPVASLTPSAGGIAFDTTYGKVRLFDGTNWTINLSGACARAWPSSGYTCYGTKLTAGVDAAYQYPIWYDKTYDTAESQTFDNFHNGTNMSGFSVTDSGAYIVPASGAYILIAAVTVVGSGVDVSSAVCTAQSYAKAQYAWTATADGDSLGDHAGHNMAHIQDSPIVTDTPWTSADDTTHVVWPGNSSYPNDAYIYRDYQPLSANLAENATDIEVTINIRARKVGCGCNNLCYGQAGGCSTCYETHTCTCYTKCHGYSSCSCNQMCYGYGTGDPTCPLECSSDTCGGDTCDVGCGADACDSPSDPPGMGECD